jgi:pyridoxal phosphate enzyme (YggS family)
MTSVSQRCEAVRQRIIRACDAAGRDPASVDLLPVSKYQPIEKILEVKALGFSEFGENYVQEGSRKAIECPDARFILIGPLQRNKAKPALQHFSEIMTVDRAELAQRLRHIAHELGVSRPVWIQLNLWDETTKQGGCREDELASVVESLENDPMLPLKGLMAIPPPDQTGVFKEMDRLRDEWQDRLGKRLLLSMGMSDDLEQAILAGSNQVRIGTAIFGDRS